MSVLQTSNTVPNISVPAPCSMLGSHEAPLQYNFSACNQVYCSPHGLMDAAVAQHYLLRLTTVPELDWAA